MNTVETNDYVMLGSFNLFNVLVMPYGGFKRYHLLTG